MTVHSRSWSPPSSDACDSLLLSVSTDNNPNEMAGGPDMVAIRQVSVVCRDWRIVRLADEG